MHEARKYAEDHGHHVTLLLGVVAEHGSEIAQAILDDMTARIMAMPDVPLLVNGITDDCLVAPPERAGVHVELRWISV